MDRENLSDDLEFNDKAFVDQEINAEWLCEGVPFVFDRNDKLLCSLNIPEKQFPHQAFFVDRLNETRAFKAMDFDGRSDDLAA